jgi:hypothetical protein
MAAADDVPAVVAVVVVDAVGDQFDEVLRAWVAQDYPKLALIIADIGDNGWGADRVEAVVPRAHVRRLPGTPAAQAFDHVLAQVGAAPLAVLATADALPAESCVSELVAEMYRSNAGICGPKVVDRDQPDRLIDVGVRLDRTGARVPIAEVGDRDQQQHDRVHEVFAAPAALQLVRLDLLSDVRGVSGGTTDRDVLDRAEPFFDLAWRTHVVGARSVVTGDAVVSAHRPTRSAVSAERSRSNDLQSFAAYAAGATKVPAQVFGLVLALVEAMVVALRGQRSEARAIVSPWRRLVVGRLDVAAARQRSSGLVRADHAAAKDQRRAPLASIAALARTPGDDSGDNAIVVLARATWERMVRHRIELLTVVGLGVLLAVSGRHLWWGRWIPIRSLLPAPDDVSVLLDRVLADTSITGLGDGTGSPGLVVAWLIGRLALGSSAWTTRLLVIIPIGLGWLGAWRLAGQTVMGLSLDTALGRTTWTTLTPTQRLARRRQVEARVKASGAVAYAATGLWASAVGSGLSAGLIAYAVAPWLVDALCREQHDLRRVARVALISLLATAMAPTAVITMVVAVLAVTIADLAAGVGDVGRRLALTVIGVVGGLVVLAPWTLSLMSSGWPAWGVGSVAAPPRLGLRLLAGLRSGPFGIGVLGIAGLVTVVAALVAVRGERARWAARAGCLSFTGLFVAVLADAQWSVTLAPDVALAVTALGFSVAVAAMTASLHDELRSTAFSTAQPFAIAGMAAAVVASVVLAPIALHGRFRLPRTSLADNFAALESRVAEERGEGNLRVLWLGDARALPGTSLSLAGGVSWSLSDRFRPDLDANLVNEPGMAEGVVADLVREAADGQLTRLGTALVPFGVTHVVVALRVAPETTGAPLYEPPPGFLDALDGQLDLRKVNLERSSLVVFENLAPTGVRRSVPADNATAGPSSEWPGSAAVLGRAASVPVLPGDPDARSWSGAVPAGDLVVSAESDVALGGETSVVDGVAVGRTVAAGTVTVNAAERSTGRLLWLVVQAAAVGVLIGVARHGGSIGRRPSPTSDPRDGSGPPVGSAAPDDDRAGEVSRHTSDGDEDQPCSTNSVGDSSAETSTSEISVDTVPLNRSATAEGESDD